MPPDEGHHQLLGISRTEVPLAKAAALTRRPGMLPEPSRTEYLEPALTARILLAEDDPDLRQLLEILLQQDGHEVITADSLQSAIEAAGQKGKTPELLIADYNLPDGHNGVELASFLKQNGFADMEVIILTGDVSASTQSMISKAGLHRLKKPVGPEVLEAEIQQALSRSRKAAGTSLPTKKVGIQSAEVIVVDDDRNFCESLTELLRAEGLTVQSYYSGEAFLKDMNSAIAPGAPVCVLIDAYLGGLSGFDVLEALVGARSSAAPIMITGNSDVHLAVQAMKAGALDFIEKPIDVISLRRAIERALETGRDAVAVDTRRNEANERLGKLTAREREVLDGILTGTPNKNIAADLGISQRTVESHRASVMIKTGCKTLPALVRLAVRAS